MKATSHTKTLIATVKSANATLTKMELSCPSREHARVVHFAVTWERPHIVNVDDSEVVVLLTNLVSQCAYKNTTLLSSNYMTFEARAMDRRRSLHLLQLGGT